MTNEHQRQANRRNAAKSSGPRSAAGRRRAGRNSYRHGLSASLPTSAEAGHIEKLAREIAGETADPVFLEQARAAAQAEFDLARIRRLKVATINQVLALGRVGGLKSEGESRVFARALLGDQTNRILPVSEVAPPLPSAEPDRTAEAIRRALPELIKLDRYENNAFIRREQAMRAIYAMHDFSG